MNLDLNQLREKQREFPHFPRPDLAEGYLAREIWPSCRKVLYAREGMGKTQFVTRDLLPEALRRGFLTIEVDFSHNQAKPAEVLIKAIEEAVEELLQDPQTPQLDLPKFGANNIESAQDLMRFLACYSDDECDISRVNNWFYALETALFGYKARAALPPGSFFLR